MVNDSNRISLDSKVLFLVNEVPDERNRTRYQHVLALAKAYDSTVLTRGGIPPAIEEEVEEWYSFESGIWKQVLPIFPIWLWCCTLRIKCDLVITGPNNLYLISGWFKAAIQGTIWVADIWDDPALVVDSYAYQSGFYARIMRGYHAFLCQLGGRVLPLADSVISSIHPDILSKYCIDELQLISLTNGISKDVVMEIQPIHIGDKTVMTYVGHVAPVRGILEFLPLLIPPNARNQVELHLIGPIDDRSKQRIDEMRLDSNIVTHGRLPHRETLRIIKSTDISLCLINPNIENYRYAYPIKIFEYAYFGTAIIASDTPGIRQILTHGDDALLIDPTISEAVTSAVTKLLNDEELRSQLGEAASERVKEFYWEDITEQLIRFIERVLDSSNCGSRRRR